MAQVHVHVHTAKPRHHPAKSTLRWADRALLGVVMGILAYGIERVGQAQHEEGERGLGR